jgi:hypothetical protein
VRSCEYSFKVLGSIKAANFLSRWVVTKFPAKSYAMEFVKKLNKKDSPLPEN